MRYPKQGEKYNVEVFNDNFREVEKTLSQKSGMIVTEHSGAMILANGTAAAPIQGLSVFGKSEQDSTTGANLWPYGDITGVAGSNVFNGSELILPAGTYTFKCDISANDGSSFTIAFYDSTGVSILGMKVMNNDVYDGASYTFTLNSDCATFVMYTRSNVTYSNPMLNAGDTALPWEPYTGGKASPNPDYPQEVVSPGDAGSLEIGVYGGNLFDSSFRNSSGNIHSAGGTATEADGVFSVTSTETDCYVWAATPVGKNYNAKYSGPIMFIPDHVTDITMTLSNGVVKANFITFYDKDLVSLGYVNSNLKSSFTAPVPEGARYFSVRFGYNDESQIGVTNSTTVMVNFGTEALPWEPYTKQSVTFSTPNGLSGIPVDSGGNYIDANGQQYIADEIRLNADGTGVWVHNVEKVVFDGNNNELWIKSYTDANAMFECKLNRSQIYNNVKVEGMCTHYKSATIISSVPNIGYSVVNREGYIRIRPEDYQTITTAEWRTRLANSPVTVLYVLAEPYETELSAEEIEAFLDLRTNKPVTTIMNDAGAYMEAELVADTKLYIDAKIEELKAALGG